MAVTRLYLSGTVQTFFNLITSPHTGTTINGFGWVVGTGATFSSEFSSANSADRLVTTFVNDVPPDGTLDLALADAFRMQTPVTGTYAAGNWVFNFAVVSTVQAGAADGRMVFRLLRGSASDGSNAVEITSAQQLGSICTNIGSTGLLSTATIALGAITLTNEYLFVQLAWRRTGAGGMTTTNIRLQTGLSATQGTTILPPDFTVYVPPDQGVTTVAIASIATLQVPTVVRPAVQDVTNPALVSTAQAFALTVEVPPVQAVTGATIMCSMSAVSYWPLDDPAGSTTVRDLAGTRVGKFRGTVTPGEPGINGSVAMTFGGGGSGVIFKTLPGLYPTFTIEAWGKRTAASSGRMPILARVIYFEGEWHCVHHTQGTTYITHHNGVTYVSASGNRVMPVDTWAHLVLVGNGTTVAVYHDGDLIGEQPFFPIPATGLGPTPSLGCFGEVTDGESWVGSLQDVAFYQRTLSAEEVAAHHTLRLSGTSAEYQKQIITGGVFPPSLELTITTGTIGRTAGLVSYWPLDTQGVRRDMYGTNDLADNGTASVPAQVGYGATFLGIQPLRCLSNSSLQMGDVDFTWLVWFKSDLGGGYVIGKDDPGSVRGMQIGMFNGDGRPGFVLNGTHLLMIGDSHTGVWVFVACWYDRALRTCNIQVNDGPVYSSASPIPILENADLTIGGLHSSYGYTGVVDETLFYKRLLSADERTSIFVAGLAGRSFIPVFPPTVEVSEVVPPEEQAIDGGTIGSTAQVRVPLAAPGPVTITTQPRASALQTFAMAIAVGAVAIASGTRTAAAQSYVPTVVPQAVTVTGATRATTAAVNAATVTPGPVSITSATRASLSQVFVASVTTGPVSVTAATLPSTISIFIPVVLLSGVSAVETVAVPSACLAHAPTVTVGAASVTSGFAAGVSQATAPSVTTATGVQAGTAPSVLVLNAPATTVGPVSITVAHRASAFSVNEPIVALAGVLNIGAVTVPTTAVLRTATVTTGPVTVTAAHRSTTTSTAAPTVIPGAVAVAGATIPTQAQVRIPSVGVGPASVTTAQIPATAILREPIVSLAGVVNVGTVPVVSTAALHVPSLFVGPVSITTQSVTQTLQTYAPVVAPAGVQVVGTALVSSTVVMRVPVLVTGPVSVISSTRGSVSVAYAPVIAVAGIQAVSLSSITTNIALTGPSIALGPVGVIAPHISAISSLNAPVVAPGAATVGVTHRASTAILNQPSLSAGAITIIGTHLLGAPRLSAPSVVNEGAPGFPEIRTAELVSLLANTMKVQLQTGLLTSQLAYTLEPALEASSLVVLIPTRILVEVA